MYKKRGRVIPRATSGQITVFMILGLLILFVFIFVFSLSAGIKKQQLQEVQEKTLSKSFEKEALRIFVEDCLTDELEKGLVLIGKQGRLWSDQPGGTRYFEEGISGVMVNNDRIFYGLIRDPYLEFENAYPCSNESNPEEFCQYSYPNTKVGFGSLELRTSTIQNDLRRFLMNRTVWCVAEFTQNNISSQAVLESQEIDLNLGIHDAGIDVKVNYPLKFNLGDEEFFHLSQFDFFYPTKFKALLDTAVSLPLRMDWQYVDFNYTKATLESSYFTYGNEIELTGGNCLLSENYFLCKQALFSEQYASLGVEMATQALPNGDDLFIFKSSSVLNSPELYTYQFARQNRAPALDYVGRMQCPAAGYDYVVIKDDPDLGTINFNLSAQEPDEDAISYTIVSDDFAEGVGNHYEYTPAQERSVPYSLTTYATDEYQVSDWQKVRVLVDRPLELDVSLFMPYKFRTSDGELTDYSGQNGIFPVGNTYLVSKEDPSFLRIIFPENSLAPPASYWQEVGLLYSNKDGVGTEQFSYKVPEGLQVNGNQGCFSFPGTKSNDCSLDGYENDIYDWDQLVSPNSPFPHFREATKNGELNLSFSAQYCAAFNESKSDTIKVVVNDCVPHRNPEHPWAYPYHEYTYSSFNFETQSGEFAGEEEINPFEATHSCCIGVADNPNDWQIADTDYPKPCFINPEAGCYGSVPSTKFEDTPYTALEPGYVLEQQQQYCSGNRGNICDGEFKNELSEGKLICGSPGQNSCNSDIDLNCANLLAFGFVEGEDAGWCHGTFGCTDFCQEPVAYTGPATTQKLFDINEIALLEEVIYDDDLSFQCGCSTAGQICDSNFDGKFNGICQGDNSCLGDA